MIYGNILRNLIIMGVFLNAIHTFTYFFILRKLFAKSSKARYTYFNNVLDNVDWFGSFNSEKYLGEVISIEKFTPKILERLCFSSKFIEDYNLTEEAINVKMIMDKAYKWDKFVTFLGKSTALICVMASAIIVGNALIILR